MRLLVCGGRSYRRLAHMRIVLACVPQGPHLLVHGDCPGADRTAAKAARELGWDTEPHPARWSDPCSAACPPGHRRAHRAGTEYCPAAGPRRNQHMVDLGADRLIVFPGGDGTRDMVERADRAGIGIWDPFGMFGDRFTPPNPVR